MKVLVIGGGESPEHEVSLASAAAVGAALRDGGHEAAFLDPADTIPAMSGSFPKVDLGGFPSVEDIKARQHRIYDGLHSEGFRSALLWADAVFNCLHGGYGENGAVSALLEGRGVAHTGPSSAACLLAWHKDRAHTVFRAAGVPTARTWVFVPDATRGSNSLLDLEQVAGRLVVKPAASGSTFGVRIVDGGAQAAEEVRRRDGDVLVEEYLPGREFTVAVVGGQVLPLIEIRGADGVFEYGQKYQSGSVEELCPAPVDAVLAAQLRDYALRAVRALGFADTDYARVDFRNDTDGQPMCLEVNALPGLSPVSLFPLALVTADITMEQFCDGRLAEALRAAADGRIAEVHTRRAARR